MKFLIEKCKCVICSWEGIWEEGNFKKINDNQAEGGYCPNCKNPIVNLNKNILYRIIFRLRIYFYWILKN